MSELRDVYVRIEAEGYRAGLKADDFPSPYDGRSKSGRAWRRGFLRGSADRRLSSKEAAHA